MTSDSRRHRGRRRAAAQPNAKGSGATASVLSPLSTREVTGEVVAEVDAEVGAAAESVVTAEVRAAADAAAEAPATEAPVADAAAAAPVADATGANVDESAPVGVRPRRHRGNAPAGLSSLRKSEPDVTEAAAASVEIVPIEEDRDAYAVPVFAEHNTVSTAHLDLSAGEVSASVHAASVTVAPVEAPDGELDAAESGSASGAGTGAGTGAGAESGSASGAGTGADAAVAAESGSAAASGSRTPTDTTAETVEPLAVEAEVENVGGVADAADPLDAAAKYATGTDWAPVADEPPVTQRAAYQRKGKGIKRDIVADLDLDVAANPRSSNGGAARGVTGTNGTEAKAAATSEPGATADKGSADKATADKASADKGSESAASAGETTAETAPVPGDVVDANTSGAKTSGASAGAETAATTGAESTSSDADGALEAQGSASAKRAERKKARAEGRSNIKALSDDEAERPPGTAAAKPKRHAKPEPTTSTPSTGAAKDPKRAKGWRPDTEAAIANTLEGIGVAIEGELGSEEVPGTVPDPRPAARATVRDISMTMAGSGKSNGRETLLWILLGVAILIIAVFAVLLFAPLGGAKSALDVQPIAHDILTHLKI